MLFLLWFLKKYLCYCKGVKTSSLTPALDQSLRRTVSELQQHLARWARGRRLGTYNVHTPHSPHQLLSARGWGHPLSAVTVVCPTTRYCGVTTLFFLSLLSRGYNFILVGPVHTNSLASWKTAIVPAVLSHPKTLPGCNVPLNPAGWWFG